ncbi:hypothetical protein [Tautonia sociabilis]|uniref:Uncharacterized protein n=1 Tax=Tautonia sociabilis TaxID=2080755 RepID=A0A432MFJ4_9BACT|nr:hypothetical protein [Tautonia sociabilis]RUL84991.1 hypothetical protein TsocGM_19295 [Tautonia sociabilis]
MDHAADLKAKALRIAGEIHQYASEKGWTPGSYQIFANMNTSWGIIRIGVASDHFKKDSGYDEVSDEDFVDLIKYLQRELSGDPGLYESISLNLCTFDDSAGLTTFYYPNLESDDVEIDFADLNPGVVDPRTAFVRASSQGGN